MLSKVSRNIAQTLENKGSGILYLSFRKFHKGAVFASAGNMKSENIRFGGWVLAEVAPVLGYKVN